MRQLNSIKADVVSYIADVLISTRIRTAETTVGLSAEANEYHDYISLLSDIRYQTDFQLMASPTEIEDLYKQYRLKRIEEKNYQIRFLLDISTYIRSLFEFEEYEELCNELADLCSMHNAVDKLVTLYDESITETIGYQLWLNLLKANPWLVACVVIRQLPHMLFIHILKDTLHEVAVVNENRVIQ